MGSNKRFLSSAEDIADQFARHSKHVLPHVARLCLISTFLEDGIRMWFQWNEQREYMDLSWRCGWFLSFLFVLVNMLGQIVGCMMVLGRIRVPYACALLGAIIVLQIIAYNILTEVAFLFRSLALAGGLLLLMSETREETKRLFAGVPSIGTNAPKNYLQLSGRILLVFMFLTLLRFDTSSSHLFLDIVGTVLIVLIALGYKTKLSTLVLIIVLTALNLYMNCWWMIPKHKAMRDFVKYDFFQTLSVIGGLLLLLAYGPGGLSIDENKKKW